MHFVEAIAMNTTQVSELAPPRFETIKPMLLAGLVERYDCRSPAGIPGQWQRFTSFLGNIPGQVDNVAYGVSYNFDDDSNFDYMCGVEVTKSSGLPETFKTLQVPAQKYAVFTHRGHVAGIRGTFTAIWGQWFPESGHKAVNAPTLERYGSEFNPLTGLGGFEIWIAIEG
jgi:AraC family transcriptional regulator